jgi:uncharacterized membrane protein
MALAIYGLVLIRFGLVDLGRSYNAASAVGLSAADYLAQFIERFVILGVPIASIAAAAYLLRRPGLAWDTTLDDGEDRGEPRGVGQAKIATVVVAAAMAFVLLNLEIHRTVGELFPPARPPALTFLWIGACFLLLSRAVAGAGVAAGTIVVVGMVGVVAKLILFDLPNWGLGSSWTYAGPYSPLDGLMRALEFAAIVGFLAYAAPRFRKLAIGDDAETVSWSAAWTATILAFVFLTLETNTALNHFSPTFRAGGVSILWTLFALAMIVVGIARRIGPARKVGLALFTIVGFKVFLVDLAELDPLYRIVAFLLLGVLTLFGAFLYLRSEAVFARPIGDQDVEAPL